MLYLARRLHFPSGKMLERQVVRIGEDGTLSWYTFDKETQSMILYDELLISAERGLSRFPDNLCAFGDIKPHTKLFLYEVKADGNLECLV